MMKMKGDDERVVFCFLCTQFVFLLLGVGPLSLVGLRAGATAAILLLSATTSLAAVLSVLRVLGDLSGGGAGLGGLLASGLTSGILGGLDLLELLGSLGVGVDLDLLLLLVAGLVLLDDLLDDLLLLNQESTDDPVGFFFLFALR